MRMTVLLTASLLLAGCPFIQEKTSFLTLCEGVRPQVCTMEYDPVCATITAGGNKTYASPCNACADDKVAAHRPGACPE